MEKLTQARRALSTLDDVLRQPLDEFVRDATLQRFEYTTEAVWKALQTHLRQREKVEERHPRGVFNTAFKLGLITEGHCLALQAAVDDRNLTSHTYVEGLAKMIHARVPAHAQAFRELLAKL
ncbi:MAG: HI0074 family nucleotidyltransferase substrate-binding subunit [Verrucomicrobiota bacterium]